ncbi:ZIP family metal transporter [Thalassotalea marina]|uniref:Divalent cation transporter n=1 Tax=Thalassotalea marina TaxID=1673741 RepID=A0A919EPW8_9GAMM|nr:divalent cation transporter [Thalassotalea marina]GHG05982.1 divalent cation transporter [Thalassotalea marina]
MMETIITIVILTGLAGACIPLGGLLANIEHLRPQWLEKELRHFIVAFGGGVMLGAVALVLVPEGLAATEKSLTSILFLLAGGVAFFAFERLLGLRRRESPQLTGLVLDYVPEAMALGGLIAMGSNGAYLMAFLIGLQNLPEGFNAFRELSQGKHHSTKRTFLVMALLVPLGPAAGIFGYFLLAQYHFLLGAIMLFASGGILYLIFQDIAPQSRLNKHWAPPLGAVFGFALSLAGSLLMPTV